MPARTDFKTLQWIGAAFAIIGSFLPWEKQGDFISYWTYGLRLFPVFIDYGGSLIILLTILIVVLSTHPPKIFTNPTKWNLVASTLLMSVSLCFVARWILHCIQTAQVIGAATLEIGLIGVTAGSILLFFPLFVGWVQGQRHRLLPTASSPRNPTSRIK